MATQLLKCPRPRTLTPPNAGEDVSNGNSPLLLLEMKRTKRAFLIKLGMSLQYNPTTTFLGIYEMSWELMSTPNPAPGCSQQLHFTTARLRRSWDTLPRVNGSVAEHPDNGMLALKRKDLWNQEQAWIIQVKAANLKRLPTVGFQL